jgi:O-antigen/teichoic acid export membrane protein
MSSFKSIGRNSIFLASSQIVEKILSFLMAIFLARYLGKGDYGRLVYATAFANLFTFFWDFGLGRLIIRDVAKDKSNASATFSSKVKFQIISCFIGVLVLSFYLILFEIRGLEALLILIFGISTALNYLSNSFRSIFIAFERAEYETYFNFALRSILLLTVFWTIHRGWELIGISLVLLFFSLLNLIGSWKLVERKFFALQFRENQTSFGSVMKDSFPIAIIIAFTTIYLQINKILLLKWVGAEGTGIYGAVDMIVMTLLIISNSLVLATFPIISRENRVNKEKSFPIYKSVFTLLITLGLPIALGGMLLNKEIISLIYGAEFSESKEVLKILIWLTPIIFLTNFTGSCLIAIEKQRHLALISGFNTALNLALNFILIPYYGYVGAAIASLTTEGVNLIIQYRVLKYYWEASIFDTSSLKIFFSLGLMGFFIHWLQGLNLFLILSGAVVLYIVSLFATGFYSQRELSTIKTWLFQR